MGLDFPCGCRVSGSWFLCKRHEDAVIGMLTEYEDEDKIRTLML